MTWKEWRARTGDNRHDAILKTKQSTVRLLATLLSLGLAISLSSLATAEETPAGTNAQQQLLSEGELDALVAPICFIPTLYLHRC
jgi:hypothetical protein